MAGEWSLAVRPCTQQSCKLRSLRCPTRCSVSCALETPPMCYPRSQRRRQAAEMPAAAGMDQLERSDAHLRPSTLPSRRTISLFHREPACALPRRITLPPPALVLTSSTSPLHG